MPDPLTAQQVVERIQTNIGGPWKASPADAIVTGTPQTTVTGITTTFAPSFDVLRKAVAGGRNMIVSRENPYWERGISVAGYSGAGDRVKPDDLQRDPTWQAKRDFIEKNQLVIYRLFDNWNARKTDAQLAGLVKALGWDKQVTAAGGQFITVKPTMLEQLARSVRDQLKIRGVRVIGKPETPVAKVALSPGFCLVPQLQNLLKEPGVDVVICGEPVEWEAGPYFNDLVAAGGKKGMIILGQEASEEPGSNEVAIWLKSFISEVPVEFIPTGEPFWVPKKA
jgi:putative NIF3 family GTP cyclohydrolase 1 type 2